MMAASALSASAQTPAQPATGGGVPDGKIAVINTTIFPAQIAELRQKYEQVQNQYKDRYQKLQTLDDELKAMENDIRTKGPSLTQEKLAEMQSTYEDKKRRGSREYEDLKAETERTIDTATRPVREKMSQFLQNYAAQRNIVVLFNLAGAAQTGSLAYWSPATDITQDFITEYNKANPVAGAAPATQPPAGAARPAATKPGAGKP
ncbi:MAG TPA: OmpH family outer membrane protein [Blastocatellia bacterium]|nr:OmpH family outer membrane protein [Blastocatellia bacterium]